MRSYAVFPLMFLCGAMAFQQLTEDGHSLHNGKATALRAFREEPKESKAEKKEEPQEKPKEEKPKEEKAPEKEAPPTIAEVVEEHEDRETFPVPTSARCIVIICIQYMIIYTVQTITRNYCEAMGYGGAAETQVMKPVTAAAQTMTYAPMLCVLFIACRMRVNFLSDGKDQPQMWVQYCMYATTFAVTAQVIVVFIVCMVSSSSLEVNPKTGDLEKPHRSEDESAHSKMLFYALSGVRYLLMLFMYGGLAGVIVGILTYLPPGEDDLSKLPAPAPAVACTMILAVLFFTAQLIVAVCETMSELAGLDGNEHIEKLTHVMAGVASSVEFAPMVSIVFLAARMRALQHDAQPTLWAQSAMYATTYALCTTAGLALVVPLFLGGTEKVNPATGEVTHDVPNATLGKVLLAVRCVALSCVYGGIACVIYSIYHFEAPNGPTEPVSPTVSCVVSLTAQFFLVYGALMVCLTVSEASGGNIPLETYSFYGAFEAAKATLPWAPMLSILFVTTRMYALLITDNKGAPQAWVQDGMWMASTSVGLSFVACIGTALMLGEIETDQDGNPKAGQVGDGNPTYLINFLSMMRYIMMIFLYGGVFLVVYGLFTLTPENANYGDGKSRGLKAMTRHFIDTFPTL